MASDRRVPVLVENLRKGASGPAEVGDERIGAQAALGEDGPPQALPVRR
ncbi:hypothetical protein [Streptomyces sp. AC550_RSS872]|nr:hypothetical protein [Streptomyces sp. AC550_RSS872]